MMYGYAPCQWKRESGVLEFGSERCIVLGCDCPDAEHNCDGLFKCSKLHTHSFGGKINNGMFRVQKRKASIWRILLSWWIGAQDEHDLQVEEHFEQACSEMALDGTFATDAAEKEAIEAELQTGNEVKECPRFAVHVAMALRAKLGVGALDRNVPGNVVLVRSRIAAALKDYNVRSRDKAAHMALIENIFFEDDTYTHVTQTRKRLAMRSKFAKWLLGDSTKRQAMQF